jgi:putative transport protein
MAGAGSLLAGHELLLLFTVILAGLLLGRLQLRGVRLGMAGVLFAGLAVGACFHPPTGRLELAPQLKEVGLVLFVYCVGLTSGPGFFSAWRKGGLRLNLATALALGCGALIAVLGGKLFGLDRGQVAGIFCGALTNTPALGAASDRLSGTALEAHPALGYSITYPIGVLGALILARVLARLRRAELDQELQIQAASRTNIASANLEVANEASIGRSLGELRIRDVVGVVVSRLRRGPEVIVPTKYTAFARGDVVTVVGTNSAIDAAIALLGPRSPEHLEAYRGRVDMRRVLVSKRALVGRTLEELELERRFNAQVTRLRRADVDLVPSGDMRLELGDRLRVVAPVSRLRELGECFGDSERELAEIDYVALALGLCAGLLLALVPLPLGGGRPLTLGTAGGPLVAALLLGRLGRTGSLVWSMPFEANQALRELGLLLFLAGVGVSAGGRFAGVLNVQGLIMLALGALVTLATTGVALLLMQRWVRASVITSLGAASGLQTQPATLAAAFEIAHRSEETYVAYSLVYPVAMIGKIVLAQVIVLLAG